MNLEKMGATGVSTKIEYPIVDLLAESVPYERAPVPDPISYCVRSRCGKSMTNCRPYREGTRRPAVEQPGRGLTGRCSVCKKGRDFVVSNRLYMLLAIAGMIWGAGDA